MKIIKSQTSQVQEYQERSETSYCLFFVSKLHICLDCLTIHNVNLHTAEWLTNTKRN
jgi:uncharacterized cysteine cluster protein YcgN (CxxCxxCC family)